MVPAMGPPETGDLVVPIDYNRVAQAGGMPDREAYMAVIREVKETFWPDRSHESILHHREDAAEFVEAIRDRVGRFIPSHVVLGALTNEHK